MMRLGSSLLIFTGSKDASDDVPGAAPDEAPDEAPNAARVGTPGAARGRATPLGESTIAEEHASFSSALSSPLRSESMPEELGGGEASREKRDAAFGRVAASPSDASRRSKSSSWAALSPSSTPGAASATTPLGRSMPSLRAVIGSLGSRGSLGSLQIVHLGVVCDVTMERGYRTVATRSTLQVKHAAF